MTVSLMYEVGVGIGVKYIFLFHHFKLLTVCPFIIISNTKMRAFEIGLNVWLVCSFGYLLHDVDGFSPSGQLFGTRFTTKASSLHLPESRAHFKALQLQDGDGEDISSSISKWDPVAWTAPRFWNSLSFRSATLLSALTLAFKGGAVSLSSGISASVHLFSFAVWFGTMWYTTFIFGLTAFKTLPRRQFGKLQSKLFPKYFNVCALTVLLQVSIAFTIFQFDIIHTYIIKPVQSF